MGGPAHSDDLEAQDLPPVAEREAVDLVDQMLDRARGLRGGRPGGQRRRRKATPSPGGRASGYSSAGPDPDRDPALIGDVVGAVFDQRGWTSELAGRRVLADWASIVGPDIASHCEPVSLIDRQLRVSAQSSAWATQLRLMSATLLARIVEQVGKDTVTSIVVTGPSGPSWKKGLWSVQGRGPRDTYG